MHLSKCVKQIRYQTLPHFHIKLSLNRWPRKLHSGKYKQESIVFISIFTISVNTRCFRIFFSTKFSLFGLSQTCKNFSVSCTQFISPINLLLSAWRHEKKPERHRPHEYYKKVMKPQSFWPAGRQLYRADGALLALCCYSNQACYFPVSNWLIAIAALVQKDNRVQSQGKASEVTVQNLNYCGPLLKPASTKKLALILTTANYILHM